MTLVFELRARGRVQMQGLLRPENAHLDHGLECWKQEPKRLSGTSLGDTNQIPVGARESCGLSDCRMFLDVPLQVGTFFLASETAKANLPSVSRGQA